MLTAALMPAVSHTLAHMLVSTSQDGHNPSFLGQICTVSGFKPLITVAQSENNSAPPKESIHHSEHCPFCSNHAGLFGLLPPDEVVIPALASMPIRPSLFFLSPKPLFVWIAAQPRGPPVVS